MPEVVPSLVCGGFGGGVVPSEFCGGFGADVVPSAFCGGFGFLGWSVDCASAVKDTPRQRAMMNDGKRVFMARYRHHPTGTTVRLFEIVSPSCFFVAVTFHPASQNV